MEINEAFAAQDCAVNQQMGWDTSKLNVNGGAIAIGHPVGALGFLASRRCISCNNVTRIQQGAKALFQFKGFSTEFETGPDALLLEPALVHFQHVTDRLR